LGDTTRLLRTGRPKEDESLMGYVVRLTEQNSYQTPAWVFNLAGLPRERFNFSSCSLAFKSPEYLRGLSSLTGVGLDELARLAHSPVLTSDRVHSYEFFGIPLPQYVIQPRSVKICPECLRESPYCRRIWELSLVTVCPNHLCLLVDECPRCKKRIPDLRNSVCVCSCEFDWREYITPSLEEDGVALSRRIHLLCGLNVRTGGSLSAQQSHITGLGLRDLTSAVIFIAGQYQGLSGATGKKFARGITNKVQHALYTRAYSVFWDWPNNFYEFLDWRRSRESAKFARQDQSKTGLCRDFGNFYGGLYRYFSSSKFDFLRTAFGEYLLSRWEGIYVPSVNRWKHPPRLRGSDRYVSRFEARRLLGVNYTLIDQYIEAGRLYALVRGGGRKRTFLIEVSSLAKLKRQLDQD
jgi:TniQ